MQSIVSISGTKCLQIFNFFIGSIISLYIRFSYAKLLLDKKKFVFLNSFSNSNFVELSIFTKILQNNLVLFSSSTTQVSDAVLPPFTPVTRKIFFKISVVCISSFLKETFLVTIFEGLLSIY